MAGFRNRRHLRLAATAFCLSFCFAAAAQSGKSSKTDPSVESVPQQTGKPLTLKPDPAGLQRNHRLILKDGTYQLVREYKVVGDRVRYLSQERDDWEELPDEFVDWDATRKWENAHKSLTDEAEDSSPGMKEAADVDKEEAAIRAEQKARTPEVAPGLELPDQDGVFVLDTFHGTPEVVELPSTDLSLNARNRHGLGVLNPLAGQTANLEIEGAHSRIHLHVNDPSFYLSIDGAGDNSPSVAGAITINTSGARASNTKHGAHSAQSGFAIVRVSQRNAVRVVGAVHLARDGSVTQDEDVIAAKGEVLPGKHWLRIQPVEPLAIGEYALVEILSPSDISQTVWDFRVDPLKGDNPGALTPIMQPSGSSRSATPSGTP
jgi:hypothetical protein